WWIFSRLKSDEFDLDQPSVHQTSGFDQQSGSDQKLLQRLVAEAKRPVLYVGGGCLNSSEELRRFVELIGIPVASTLMGLGSYPCSYEKFALLMLGMRGTVYANYAMEKSDLWLAFGVRCDDRVTGKLEAFASRAKIVHIDIDFAEIGKNKQPHLSICGEVKLALDDLNSILDEKQKFGNNKFNLDFSTWRKELNEQKVKHLLTFKTFGDAIPPQYAIQMLNELTGGKAIIGGLGAMGFRLPAPHGASVARLDAIVVDIDRGGPRRPQEGPPLDIDGDGSFIMNVQELAKITVENLPVKIMLLYNHRLGMVVQWEDRFYKANRAHTYLGNPDKESEIFPNMLKFA
ncbi:hypothetical protein RD792_011611, partial [Penstemon davidsonii]